LIGFWLAVGLIGFGFGFGLIDWLIGWLIGKRKLHRK
jgi:hypothetical protein